MDSPNMQAEAPASKKKNTPMIIGAVVVVILCCCCLIGLGAFGYSRYVAGKALTDFNNQVATSMPNGSSPSLPSGSTAGTVPTGGLGDEITRTTAWGYALTAIVQKDPMSCQQPDAADTTIEVTKQPDSSGVWQERWTVACGGGTSIPVDLTFTPAGAGIFTVKATLGK
jgi:hypothetical protein